VEALFENRNLKAFAKLFKEEQENWGTPEEFLRQAGEFLALRSYEKYYGDIVPHAFFGITCVASLLSIFPEERKWWPCVQQGWLASNERRRQPWSGASLAAITDLSEDERWLDFCRSHDDRNMDRCYALARGFLSDENERNTFRSRSLRLALDDTAQSGIKFIHLFKAWAMAEQLEWKKADQILFPSLHLLTIGPTSTQLSDHIKVRNIPEFDGTESSMDENSFELIQEKLLFGETLDDALDGLSVMHQMQLSIQTCMDTLMLIAAQGLNNAQMGRWSPALRAFLYTDLCKQSTVTNQACSQGYFAMMAAGLIHQASSNSRESSVNRQVTHLTKRAAPPDGVNTLRSLISHSDPFASADTVRSMISEDEATLDQLFETLLTLTAKNDGRMATGYDLLLVEAAIRGYRESVSDLRDRLPVACGFFLGRVLKNYELFGAYGVK
jgi:hypothetical protein